MGFAGVSNVLKPLAVASVPSDTTGLSRRKKRPIFIGDSSLQEIRLDILDLQQKFVGESQLFQKVISEEIVERYRFHQFYLEYCQ